MDKEYVKIFKTYERLGIHQILPTLEQIESALTSKQKTLIKKYKAQLVITPAIDKDYTLKDLLKNIDSWVWEPLWKQCDVTGPMKVSFVVPEVFYTNQTIDEQRKSLKKEKDLTCISPAEAVMWEILYKPKVLIDYWLRFVDLPNKTVDGLSFVGDVLSAGGLLWLNGSGGLSLPYFGVGLSVVANVTSQSLSLPTSSATLSSSENEILVESSSELRDNTRAILKLTATLERIFK